METLPTVNFVEPSVTILHENDPFKMIELAGRTCYKSEDKITNDSALKFVKALLKNGHFAMIEHAVLTFRLTSENKEVLDKYASVLDEDDFIRVTFEPEFGRLLVSADVRAILQRNWYDPIYKATIEKYPDFALIIYPGDDKLSIEFLNNIEAEIVDAKKIKDLTEDEFYNHVSLSARFITDRGVTHEIVRHRLFSFAQESTRYCNYSKEKFGGHLTFCKPATYDEWSENKKTCFNNFLLGVDDCYNYLTSDKDDSLTPQIARAVLPNCLKTEIVVTGPAGEWKHFFNLRSKGVSGTPHPDMKKVADIAKTKMNNYLYSIKFDQKHHF